MLLRRVLRRFFTGKMFLRRRLVTVVRVSIGIGILRRVLRRGVS